jgi:Cu-processing system ATP-binding protein
MIEIKELHKKFGKNEVIKGLNYQSSDKGIVTILGPNGSGKTTLIKVILGMVIPDSGSVLLNNYSILDKYEYRNIIDYLPQIARFPENITVRELIYMIKNLRGSKTRDEYLITYFGLTPFLNKRLVALSGGWRQKVNLVVALMFDSPYLILDEPTSGLDPLSVVKLKKFIIEECNRDKLILVSTHILSFVEEMASELLILDEGKVKFTGTLEELKRITKQSKLENALATMQEISDV